METLEALMPEQQKPAFRILKKAWAERNRTIFDDAQRLLGELLTAAVLDGEPVRAETLLERVGIGRQEINAEYTEARRLLAERLADRVERTTNSLILLHGLEGQTGRMRTSTLSRDFQTPEKVSESIWGVLGSFAGGAMGGLIADLKAGGLTFGGGALLGGLISGGAAYAVIRSYNLVRGGDEKLHWSREHFREQTRLSVLCYLAVAHFGRGRGAWQDSEQPEHWRDAVDQVAARHQDGIDLLWKGGVEGQLSPEDLSRDARRLMLSLSGQVLHDLYGRV